MFEPFFIGELYDYWFTYVNIGLDYVVIIVIILNTLDIFVGIESITRNKKILWIIHAMKLYWFIKKK